MPLTMVLTKVLINIETKNKNCLLSTKFSKIKTIYEGAMQNSKARQSQIRTLEVLH